MSYFEGDDGDFFDEEPEDLMREQKMNMEIQHLQQQKQPSTTNNKSSKTKPLPQSSATSSKNLDQVPAKPTTSHQSGPKKPYRPRYRGGDEDDFDDFGDDEEVDVDVDVDAEGLGDEDEVGLDDKENGLWGVLIEIEACRLIGWLRRWYGYKNIPTHTFSRISQPLQG